MRLFAVACLLTLLGSLVIALEPDKHPAGILPPGRTHDWLKFIASRDKTMTRVTEQAQKTELPGSMICVSDVQETREFNPHSGHTIHVYVTKGEEQKIRTGEGTYPVGTLIVKEKWIKVDPPAKDFTETKQPVELDFSRNVTNEKLVGFPKLEPPNTPELFTVMLKREAGYNPDCGDWEFMVVSGDTKRMLARGKIDSCIDCHKGRNRNDYVTQLYPLPKKP